MKRNRTWMLQLANAADLTDEPFPGIPLVEIAGDQRVLIEQHSGVTEYGSQQISVKVNFGTICIIGQCLELTRMTGEQLIVSGHIECVKLTRRPR